MKTEMYCSSCEKETDHYVETGDIDETNSIEVANGDPIRTYTCCECSHSFDDI